MIRKLGIAALAVATIAGSAVATSGTAVAQRWHHHHHHGGSWVGPAVVGGLAFGALAAAAAPRCWVEERVIVDRRGRERIRPLRICR
jgi:hypothetical protein